MLQAGKNSQPATQELLIIRPSRPRRCSRCGRRIKAGEDAIKCTTERVINGRRTSTEAIWCMPCEKQPMKGVIKNNVDL